MDLYKNLPLPLDSEEQDRLCKLWYEARNEEARTELIKANLRLVAYIVQRFPDTEKEELFSIGVIGLIKAVDNFNPYMSIKFTTFAARCITNELRMGLRNRVGREVIYLDECIASEEDGGELCWKDIVGSNDIEMEKFFMKEELKWIKKKMEEVLTYREKKILELAFFEGMTHKEIGDILDLSQSYVTRLIQRSLLKLRRLLLNSV